MCLSSRRRMSRTGSGGCSATAATSASGCRTRAQPKPEGLAQAFLIGREFVGDDRVALALGDNIFYGAHLSDYLRCAERASSAPPSSPIRSATRALRRRRVRRGRPRDQPRGEAGGPRSSYAVTGLYFYDNQVVDIAAALSLQRAASSKSPMSTAPTSNAGNCRSRGCRAGSPGSTPARTTRSCRRPITSRRSRNVRA